MKKIIAFDLDGTLAESKSALSDEMGGLLHKLLDKFEVCVISGGKFEQFEKQLIGNLSSEKGKFEKLHIMPTCGTRYYRYNFDTKNWNQKYAEDFADSEKKKIISALNKAIDELGLRESNPWGELIEDRGSQITYSALGQQAPIDAKDAWDPDGKKKLKIRDKTAEYIPEFEVRAGGSTSIDVTKLGIDKAYGMNKLMEALDADKSDILFIGDKLQEGGNDYPVKAMGIDSIEVSSWKETALILEGILHIV